MILNANRKTVGPIVLTATLMLGAGFGLVACKKEAPAAPPMQAMPVQVSVVAMNPVPTTDTYVSTIKSRRSVTMQPQVDGNLTRINVKSGDVVRAGQVLMTIDPLKQQATVEQQQGTEAQKSAVYNYNKVDVERQRKLYAAGVTSKEALDQAEQAYSNSLGDYNSSVAGTTTQKQQLGYYQIRAPFSGVVGDIPVHLGDYVSPTTILTTVDENKQLEAYIYIPAERAADVKNGLPVEILGTGDAAGVDQVLGKTAVYFISPQVDNNLQSILAKAPVDMVKSIRNQQLVKARITWSTAPKPVVPVLAVTRIGGQAFVYVATKVGDGYICKQVPVALGDTIGNTYPVLSGLKEGDKVIISGIQFLADGVPVKPLG